jgi:Gpi18-like mannosyltransferase
LQFDKREIAILVIMLAFSFIIRFLLFPIQGYQNDMATYSYWFNTAADQGVRHFYTYLFSNPATSWVDYPPFNVYLFWAFGSLANSLGASTITFVKLLPNLFDMAISALIFFFLRKQLSFKQTLVATALYGFNPAVVFNAAIWGQFDAIYTFFLVLSLMLALKSKPELSAAAFAVGLLTKPQGIALLPLVAFVIFKKSGAKRFLFSVLVFTSTLFLVILPFEWSDPITFLTRIYFGAYGNYAVTSANAFNLWGLFSLWSSDSGWFILGWVIFGIFTVFALYVLNKRWDKQSWILPVFVAFMMFFAFFMLPTRIHERYLFPAVSMLVLLFPLVKKARQLYVVITATLFANLAYILYWLNQGNPNLSGDPVVVAVSVINLVTFLYGILLLTDELKGKDALKIQLLAIDEQKEKVATNQ